MVIRDSHQQSLGLLIDAHRRVPPCKIEVPKDPRDVKLRSPEGPHDIWSLAVPQHKSARTVMNLGSLVANNPQDAKLRSPEEPHNILSLAISQPMSNQDTKTTYTKSKDTARPFQITEHQLVMVSDKDLNVAEACAQLQTTPFGADDMKQQTLEENLWEYESRLQADCKTAQINEEAPFVDFYKKGIYDSELRELLLLHKPPLATMMEVKTAVHLYQTRLLKLARSTPDIEPSAATRLEAMWPEIADREQETTQQIPELQQQLAPSTDSKTSRPGPMEINAITEYNKDPDDGSHMSHLAGRPNGSPFIDSNTQNYGEAERTMESTSVSQTGNTNHMQEMGHHLSCEGHIETSGPARIKLGPPSWVKLWPRAKKMLMRKHHSTGGEQRRRSARNNTLPRKRHKRTGARAEKPQSSQQ